MKNESDKSRPIDKLRNGAGSFDLTTSDDHSEITGLMKIGGRLLIVRGKGIYEIKLADQVDPERISELRTPYDESSHTGRTIPGSARCY